MISSIIRKFIKIYLLVLCIFSVFRLILFINESDRIDETTSYSDISIAFVTGVRFDIVVSGYLLILPYFILTFVSYLRVDHKKFLIFFFYFIFILFSISFFITTADIPYFGQFFSRISVTALEWLNTPGIILGMIIGEPAYWIFIFPFIFSIAIFYKILKYILLSDKDIRQEKKFINIFCSLLFLLIIFCGIRGRIAFKSPIRVGTAYFSNNAFLNQLGLNPCFTFIRSYLNSIKSRNKSITLMDNEKAILNVQKYLKIQNPDKDYPFARKVHYDSSATKPYNIVIVIMESMSAAKMKRHGNQKNLTPFLDSISQQGYYFNNAYTAGLHTFNGIYGTLMSMPSLYRQHPMKRTDMLKYSGIFNVLKQNNYSTLFFTTADGQFDNTEGFMYSNDCEQVIAQSSYPPEEVKTTLGVPDDYMFRFSIPILNDLHSKGKPFVSAFMTVSDHAPYFIPDYFSPKSSEIRDQIVEYADFSLRKLIESSSLQPWFNNTIFVFVADHGSPIDGTYDMSLDYNHTPLLFYAPEIIKTPQVFNNMAGQIDIFPSLMGFLNIPYTNNTPGIDLFSEERPYIFFNGDDKYGVINREWFLIVKEDKSKGLYKYRKKDKFNYAETMPEQVNKMQKYAASHLQACQYVIDNKKQ